MMQKILSRSENDATRPFGHHEGLFRGPPAAHGYDTPEVRKEDAKVGNTGMIQAEGDRRP